MKIETTSGFKCVVNENKVKDWRYVNTSARMAKSSDELQLINDLNFLFEFLLGEEQTAALIEHVKDEDGVALTKPLVTEFREITALIGEKLKKSSTSSK